MDQEKKYYNEIAARLRSENKTEVLDAIKELRHTGTPKHIPLIIALFNKKTASEVRESVHRFLSDLKSQEVVPVLVQEIEKGDFGEDLPQIMADCWESGLNFSNHLPVFTEIFITGNYQTSLEAFTVIEYSLHDANTQIKEESIRLLEDKKEMIAEDKNSLYTELLRILKNIPDVPSLKISF